MSNFKSCLFLLCLFYWSCSAKNIAQQVDPLPSEVVSAKSMDSLGFPESWVGIWAGELSIFNAKGKAQSLPMELHIQKLDSVDRFSWTIIYGEDKVAGARNYQLVVKDREKGEYVVDELNSIELECYLLQNKLFSWYLVGEVLILITNEVNGEEMVFEVIAGSHNPVSVTGGKEVDGEDIPEVSTYPVKSNQKAILTRKK